jgi:predicted metal-dependent peptidase
MKFSKIIGKVDPAKVKQAEEKLSSVFVELSLSYDNKSPGSGIGGDPFIFTLVYPIEQICINDGKITTAATDGRRYYWNPDFVLSLSRVGLRFVVAHEAFHAIYMHPSRRGGRLARLWNIAVDYIVNYNIMCDLKQRQFDPARMFKDNLGKYIELKAYADIISGKAKWPKPVKDKNGKDESCFFADPNLPEDLRKPEAIYEYLYNLLEKCPKCGKMQPKGTAAKQQEKEEKEKNGEKTEDGEEESDKGKKGKKGKSKSKDGSGEKGEKGEKGKGGKKGKKGKGEEPGDSEEPGDQPGEGEGHDCDGHGHEHGEGEGEGGEGEGEGEEGEGHTCDNHGDCFGAGGLVDDHLDSDMSQEDLAKRLADAAEISRRLAGKVPAGLEDELGELLAPKLTWQDFIRMRLVKARAGNGRNDWNRFRTRPLASGMLVPKRKDYFANFRVLLDTSGSMAASDMAFGISQLQAIDEKGEGTVTPADCEIYWNDTVKLKKANKEELSKVKVIGRGGTMFSSFFDDYEKKLGKADFLIMITDGYLMDDDLRSMKKPPVEVYWLITSGHRFTPPFGRVFHLKNE